MNYLLLENLLCLCECSVLLINVNSPVLGEFTLSRLLPWRHPWYLGHKQSAYSVGDMGSILEKRMTTHSSTVAWIIPWTEEPGSLQSMGSQRIGHDWVTNTHTHTHHGGSTNAFIFCSWLNWPLENLNLQTSRTFSLGKK